ncbi:MAG: phage antirepressor KilAC domain-containing protein, partial [Fusobacteriaceae bacterium]
IQRSEKGKQLREYFLDLERAWNSPEQVMARALQMAERVQNELRLQLSEAKPKVEYFDKVLDSTSCFTTTQIAKEMQMTARMLNTVLANNGVQFKQSNQWQLTVEYQGHDYTKVRTSLDAKGNTHHTTVWTEKGREFILGFMENV